VCVCLPDCGFERQFVDAHNDYRRKHGAPPLALSRDLCNSAQKWADHLLTIKSLKHSSTNHGENLYYAYSSTPKKPVGEHMSEKKERKSNKFFIVQYIEHVTSAPAMPSTSHPVSP
jgi:uncharacterized protein YkwD